MKSCKSVGWREPLSCDQHRGLVTDVSSPLRLFTRYEALRTLRIGETTLFWLQRTGKLKAIHIGSRVLFDAAEIERIAANGASLTGAEKQAAAQRSRAEGRARSPKPGKRRVETGAAP
jgi:hypothetical protein